MKTVAMITGGCVLLATLGGCATGTKPDPAYAHVRAAEPKPVELNNGSIYQAGHAVSLFEDLKARRVGDVLTVVLVENTSASKQASTNTSKTNEIDLQNPTLLGSAGKVSLGKSIRGVFPLVDRNNNNFQVNADTSQEFTGTGGSSQSNKLSGNITVSVVEVLPNGYLVVRGEKILALNEGDEYVRLSGIIRPHDVRPDNTVLSTQVANAQIAYAGNGALADANSHGWLSRFFLKLWPF